VSSGPRRSSNPFELLRPSYDGPSTWLWFVGAARIGVLLVVAMGTQLIAPRVLYPGFLAFIYVTALVASLWYIVALRREQNVSAVLTWMQVLVDFGVVAATISFTGGQDSFFTFLLVIVILEAGVLMGLVQGFLFASLATVFMFFQFIQWMPQTGDPLSHWYNFLIQGIAFFFTAFISGYWNQRVSRMKQFQREILDNMNSGFLITDNKGLVIAMNRAACSILEISQEDVAGRHAEGIIVPASRAESPVVTALRLGKDFSSYEFYAECGSGEPRLLGLTTNRISDSHGNVTGLIASFIDLTEMARMRQELQQQDRLAVVGELAAGLAHEIRNPVAAIRGAMEELNEHIDDRRMTGRLANIAIRESDHLNNIVSGFLDFARNPTKQYETVDVLSLLAELREDLERRYSSAEGLHLKLVLPERPVAVDGNPTQLRQVFLNIAQNAVEAMQAEGRLTITLSVQQQGPVEICFEDTGPGIPPDKVARIFEPFYTDKAGGVGMGLAICMRIITAHDGMIQVGSRTGGGTSMTVRLPAAKGL